MFWMLLSSFLALDLAFWLIADRRMRPLRRASLWRSALAIFMSIIVLYVLTMLIWPAPLRRSGGRIQLPLIIHATAYLWHFIPLPIAMVCLLIGAIGRGWRWLVERRKLAQRPGFPVTAARGPKPSGESLFGPASSHEYSLPPAAPTRRQVIAAAAIAIPPLANWALAAGAVLSMYGRRLRSFDLTIPHLPRSLDGMTITHVSDTHIGKFFHPDRLPSIAQDINKLDSDFIVFTGDLIDMSLEDLRYGIDFLRSINLRRNLVVCEGNHDLMEDRGEFENAMRDAGLPLIVGEQFMLPRHSRDGRGHPVQFLAVPWNGKDQEMNEAVQVLSPTIRPDAFPILLAHHPHSFDAAAAAGFPLVLSGHTHGGQIMLNSQVGLGRIRFRYTSGLYEKPGSKLIVNNGLGNWFPLRINAPAELVHITLHSA